MRSHWASLRHLALVIRPDATAKPDTDRQIIHTVDDGKAWDVRAVCAASVACRAARGG
jgi:hypothetical protein